MPPERRGFTRERWLPPSGRATFGQVTPLRQALRRFWRRIVRTPPTLGVTSEELRRHAVDSSLLFITLTNAGYLPYTCNLLASLERVGLAGKMIVFCIDEESLRALRAAGVPAYRVESKCVASDFQAYREGTYREVVLTKLRVVHELLERGFDVFFTDGDIVFLDDPIDRLKQSFAGADLVVQNDDPYQSEEADPSLIELCLGFFLVRPTRATLRVFDPERVRGKTRCDQTHVNSLKWKIESIAVLDRDLFPNGSWFLDRPGDDHAIRKQRAQMIHFNWRIGAEKVRAMKLHSLWQTDAQPHADPISQ